MSDTERFDLKTIEDYLSRYQENHEAEIAADVLAGKRCPSCFKEKKHGHTLNCPVHQREITRSIDRLEAMLDKYHKKNNKRNS